MNSKSRPGSYAERLDNFKVNPNPARKLVLANRYTSHNAARQVMAQDELSDDDIENRRSSVDHGPANLYDICRFAGFSHKHMKDIEGYASKAAMADYSAELRNLKEENPIDTSMLPAAGLRSTIGSKAPYMRQINERDIMPTPPLIDNGRSLHGGTLHVDTYKWFRKPLKDNIQAMDDNDLIPRGCETKSISRQKRLEDVAGTMRGTAALVVNEGETVGENSATAANTTIACPYTTAHEIEFRKRLHNKRILGPPGGGMHREFTLHETLFTPSSSSPRRMRRAASLGPSSIPHSITYSCLDGAACVPTGDMPLLISHSGSVAYQPQRGRSEISMDGFTEHTRNKTARERDILRFDAFTNDSENSLARPGRRRLRASSCPPIAIRKAENGEKSVMEQSAGIASTPREEQQPATPRDRSPKAGRTSAGVLSCIQYDRKKLVESAYEQRLADDSTFAQRCREIANASTFAGRVAETIRNTNRSSNSEGVRGCFQWN
jgi:hypothetical protein